MQDNSGLRAGDITNGAHSRNTSSSKKESSSSKSNNNTSFSQMLRDFADKLKAAEAAAAKSQKNADNVVDKFIGNLRSADSDTQKKIIERLRGQSLDEILHPDITNGAHSPARNGASTKSNNTDMDIMDEYGNYKLSDGKGLISYNPEALEEERASRGTGGYTVSRNEPGTVGAANGSDVVDYTYAPGDTFGQVLIKMGLSDGRNLWGPNGDVEYYRKQLNDQGIYGNIPIGRTIRLRRRK